MTTTCQGCGHHWTAEELKRTGVHHFSAISQRRVVAEPTGTRWEINFGPEGDIVNIKQCNLCPIVLISGAVAEG